MRIYYNKWKALWQKQGWVLWLRIMQMRAENKFPLGRAERTRRRKEVRRMRSSEF